MPICAETARAGPVLPALHVLYLRKKKADENSLPNMILAESAG